MADDSTTCNAPMVVKINGEMIPLPLHCSNPRGHAPATDHGCFVKWPGNVPVGVVLDVTMEAQG